MKKADALFSAVLMAVAAAAIYIGSRYKFMANGNIGPGFVPICISVLLFISCAANLVKSLIESKNDERPFFVNKESRNRVILYFVGFILFVLAIELVGVLIAGCIYMFLIYFFFDKKPLINSILVSVGTTVALYLIFNVWLKLSLPMGLLA